MEAYCVKCRAKREMKNAKAITMKNGKPATHGFSAAPSILARQVGANRRWQRLGEYSTMTLCGNGAFK